MSSVPKAKDIPLVRIKELLSYDPLSGVFRWKVKRRGIKEGGEAGQHNVYVRICVDGVTYLAHRIAFFWIHGYQPKMIDHINHNTYDNRILNLREVDRTGNARNQVLPKGHPTGVMGVHIRKDRPISPYSANIRDFNGKKIKLGCFPTLEEAVAARRKAEKEYPYHERHGEKPAEIKRIVEEMEEC